MINIKQIKVDVLNNDNESIKKAILKKLKVDKINNFNIIKQSIDARDKNQIFYVYEVDVDINNEDKYINKDITKSPDRNYYFNNFGNEDYNLITIVGMGPCGLFSAYNLLRNGYKVLLIDRGEKVESRINTIEDFWNNNNLNTNSNVQFGEGGAGTFSDGKLNTLVKDLNNRGRFVFNTFIDCGAPKEILYSHTPHIGTDKLREVIINLRKEIITLGGEIRYNTQLTDLDIEDNKLKGIYVNNDEYIKTDILVLALGHSARDTFYMLKDYLDMENKPFAMGIRIQHDQDMINYSQYGKKYYKHLPNANYKLTYTTKDKRGVYSFCMCPGGYVVNSSSELNKLCINGMSYYKRDSGNANSALIVTIDEKDYGSKLLDGVKFQRELEEKTYQSTNGLIPVQLLKDYFDNKVSNSFGELKPKIKGNYKFANINEILPEFMNNSIKEAIKNYSNKIKGFDKEDSIISCIEARTSSPIRILRNEELESNIKGIYPAGEGCGYAGGITSAAIDGIKVSESIMKTYRRLN